MLCDCAPDLLKVIHFNNTDEDVDIPRTRGIIRTFYTSGRGPRGVWWALTVVNHTGINKTEK